MIDLSHETEALARRLADVQHLSLEETVRQALEERARAAVPAAGRPRDRSPETVAARRLRMEKIAAEIAAMPVLDPRSPSEIVDDLNGL